MRPPAGHKGRARIPGPKTKRKPLKGELKLK